MSFGVKQSHSIVQRNRSTRTSSIAQHFLPWTSGNFPESQKNFFVGWLIRSKKPHKENEENSLISMRVPMRSNAKAVRRGKQTVIKNWKLRVNDLIAELISTSPAVIEQRAATLFFFFLIPDTWLECKLSTLLLSDRWCCAVLVQPNR